MIPHDWLGPKLSIKEIENMSRLDVLGIDESRVVDKDPTFKQSFFADHPNWLTLKLKAQRGDTFHIYEQRGMQWMSMGGTRGIALVRDGQTVDVMILPPRVRV